jgi:hypothetical protein
MLKLALLFCLIQLALGNNETQYYIDAVNGNDIDGCGSSTSPCKSLGFTIQTTSSNVPSIIYRIAPGFYKGLINTNISWGVNLTSQPSIQISGAADETTVFDFGGLAHNMWTFLNYNGNISIIGVTFQNMFGVGMFFANSQPKANYSYILENCIFQRNNAGKVLSWNIHPYGPCLNIQNNANNGTNVYVDIVNTNFFNNNGDLALHSFGSIVITAGNVDIRKNTFRGNSASFSAVAMLKMTASGPTYTAQVIDSLFDTNNGNQSASIYSYGYNLVLQGSTIVHNYANEDILIIDGANIAGQSFITNTTINNNTAEHAVHLSSATGAYVTTFRDSAINYNNNSHSTGFGVGIFCNSSTLYMTSTTVTGNVILNGSTGDQINMFGCLPNQPTAAPTAPTNAPTPPNTAAIVVPILLIIVLAVLGVVVYFKWDVIRPLLGSSGQYTVVDENTRINK